jgi:YNFM family putative membrane transporter
MMRRLPFLGLRGLVFALVAAAFTNIYLPQPILPVLSAEFRVSAAGASMTISMVILGIALSNLPFGRLGDRYPIRPIILAGGAVIIAGGVVSALTQDFALFIAARFLQGLFLPALTTCLAAHLANSLPADRLNVIMGSYISATVVGGLGGRLLGGFIHQRFGWRSAFLATALLLLLAVIAAVVGLPDEPTHPARQADELGYLELLSDWHRLGIYGAAFGSFWVFSSAFNYLPFYLSGPPFHAPTNLITLLYLAYLVGAVMGPVAGMMSDRIGNAAAMAMGAVAFGLALAGTLTPSLLAVMASLGGICAGFFTTHAAAVGALNSTLHASRGRANALYVLSYYAGGYVGITVSGFAYRYAGWLAIVVIGVLVLLLPLCTGVAEMAFRRQKSPVRRRSG